MRRRVAAVVFVTVLLLDGLILVPTYARLRDNLVEGRAAEAVALIAAAVDPAQFPSLENLNATGQHLVRATRVAGGSIMSGEGEIRAQFGAPPELTWLDARINGRSVLLRSGAGTLDVFVSPEVTRIPYGVILRLDVSKEWRGIVGVVVQLGLLGLAAALVLAAVTMLAVSRQVVRPLEAIRQAVDTTLNGPEAGEGTRSGVSRTDEIGALARAVDQLLFLTSAVLTDELAAASAIIDSSPHAILVFSEQGHLVSANPASLDLFGEASYERLLRRDLDSLFRFEGGTVSANELVTRGRVLGNGEIIRGGQDFPCLVAGDTVRRPDGSVLRHFLILVDMRDLVEAVRNEVHRRTLAENEVDRLSSEIGGLRRMFDACLVMLELDRAGAARPKAVTVLPKRLIDAWTARRVAESATFAPQVATGELPPLLGDPGETRRLFEMALDVVRMRSGADKPIIQVGVSVDEAGEAMFLVHEQTIAGARAPIGAQVDLAIMIGALSVLCRRQNGGLVNTTGPDDANTVMFRMPVDLRTVGFGEAAASEAA